MTPTPSRRRRARRLPAGLVAAVLAVALHGLVAGVVFVLAALGILFGPPTPQTADPLQAVGLRALTADEWAQNRGEKRPDEKKPNVPSQRVEAPKKKEPPKEERPEGQIVDVAPGNNETSEDAEYIAESSNKVEKESRAKEQTAFYRNAMPKRTTTTPDKQGDGSADRAEKAGNDGAGDDDRPASETKEKKLAVEVPDVKARDELQLDAPTAEGQGPVVANRDESAEVHGNSDRLKLQDGSPSDSEDGSSGRSGKPGALNLMPSIASLDKLVGGAPNDHLDEDEGDGTFLNTREWKYAGFFNRVKQSIGMHWDPSRELRHRDPTGNVYGTRDRHTVLQVTLDDRGRILDIYVQKSCGLDFLDLEAVQSFERAQPFPNPPPALLTSDAKVSFQFGFFVDMGGAPRMRMFRKN